MWIKWPFHLLFSVWVLFFLASETVFSPSLIGRKSMNKLSIDFLPKGFARREKGAYSIF
jgi:hypothetical protein